MRRNNQNKFGTKNSEGARLSYGNCFATSLANILDLQVEMVPNIEVFYMPGDSKKENPMWLDVINIWLHHKHKKILIKTRELSDLPKRGYFIARGMSPRGTRHCICMSQWSPAFDPHPSHEGLISIDYFLYLKNVE